MLLLPAAYLHTAEKSFPRKQCKQCQRVCCCCCCCSGPGHCWTSLLKDQRKTLMCVFFFYSGRLMSFPVRQLAANSENLIGRFSPSARFLLAWNKSHSFSETFHLVVSQFLFPCLLFSSLPVVYFSPMHLLLFLCCCVHTVFMSLSVVCVTGLDRTTKLDWTGLI